MLILLFLFALVRHLQGAPTTILSIQSCNPTDVFIRDDSIRNHLTTRVVYDVVFSCLATIFTCTWTAIHPNIPSPCDSGWEIFKRQVTTMIYAILAPEMIMAWALRQHLAARRIAREYNEKIANGQVVPEKSSLAEKFTAGVREWFHRKSTPQLPKEGEVVPWTITHGFFIQMGGFVMCEGGKPIQTLQLEYYSWAYRKKSLQYQVKQGCIDPPTTTEGEIEDRSKGDGFTKTIVVLQTTWFIAQCIVRWSTGLPATELEILTLGFAMLNGITYALWCHKPQSVQLPVYLQRKLVARENATEQPGEVVEEVPSQAQGMTSGSPSTAASPVQEKAPLAKRSELSKDMERYWRTGWQRLWRTPFALMLAALRPPAKMIDFSETIVKKGELRVSMFHSANAKDVIPVWITSSAIASLFGLIRFIPAWFLDFPSHSEMLIWHLSSGIITVQPIFVVLAFSKYFQTTLFEILDAPLPRVAFFGVYIIARISLIILALLSLRTLHENELVIVKWLSFIPHL